MKKEYLVTFVSGVSIMMTLTHEELYNLIHNFSIKGYTHKEEIYND